MNHCLLTAAHALADELTRHRTADPRARNKARSTRADQRAVLKVLRKRAAWAGLPSSDHLIF